MGLAGFAIHEQGHGLHRGGVMLPNKDDIKELVVYLTMLFIVMSWMLREIHLAFFATTMDSRQSTEAGARSQVHMAPAESFVVPVPVVPALGLS